MTDRTRDPAMMEGILRMKCTPFERDGKYWVSEETSGDRYLKEWGPIDTPGEAVALAKELVDVFQKTVERHNDRLMQRLASIDTQMEQFPYVDQTEEAP